MEQVQATNLHVQKSKKEALKYSDTHLQGVVVLDKTNINLFPFRKISHIKNRANPFTAQLEHLQVLSGTHQIPACKTLESINPICKQIWRHTP
ncbi:hypothetical protein MTP99_008804 [Tenebrio molitor]|jgi:hypothetical protein|nr:hypothetical protein MTP99_008804 [Tenebrio molitor]